MTTMNSGLPKFDRNWTRFRGQIVSVGEDGFAIRTPLDLKLYRPWEADWFFVDQMTEYLYLRGMFDAEMAEPTGAWYIGQWVEFQTSEEEQAAFMKATWDGLHRRGLTHADYGIEDQ